jgi:outer membrane biosynthesis protein TonB
MCCRAPRLPFEIKTKMLCARALSSVQQQVSARKNKDEQQQPQPTTTAAAATTTTTATTTTAKTTPHSFSLRMMNREHVRRRRGVWSGENAQHQKKQRRITIAILINLRVLE